MKKFPFILTIIVFIAGILPAQTVSAAPATDGLGDMNSPVTIELASEMLSDTEVRVTATVASSVESQTLEVTWTIPEGVTIVDGEAAISDTLAVGEPKTYALVVHKETPGRVSLFTSAMIILGEENTWAASAELVLDTPVEGDVNGPLRALPPEEAPALRLNDPASGTGRVILQRGHAVPAPVDPGGGSPVMAPDSAPPENRGHSKQTVTIYGGFEFNDYPVYLNGAQVDLYSGTPRPIRRAQVWFVRWDAGDQRYRFGKKVYTDEEGYFQVTDGAYADETVEAWVCPMEKDSQVRVMEDSKNYRCIASYSYSPTPNVYIGDFNVGISLTPDEAELEGMFNIYDTALKGFEFLAANGISIKKQKLTYKWRIGSPEGPHYHPGKNVVELNGEATNGDQWDDTIILHEMGHFVMDRYAKIPPNPKNTDHGNCTEISNPYDEKSNYAHLAYTEGWATFFALAVTRWLGYTNAYYLHLNYHGTIYNRLPGSVQNLENIGSGSTNTWNIKDHATNMGNWCEYQITGALLDILDSTNENGNDTLSVPFTSIYTAFRTKYNGHYPYSINEWWYGWTGTASRGQGTSLGNDYAVWLNLYSEHSIDVGLIVYVTAPSFVTAHLWMPSEYSNHLYPSNTGNFASYPFAWYHSYSSTLQVLRITSPYKGTYKIGANGAANMSVTGSSYTVSDASKPSTFLSPVTTYVRTGKNNLWWFLLEYNGKNGKVSNKNSIQKGPPGKPFP